MFSLPSRRPIVKSLMTFLLPSSSLLLKFSIDLFKAALNTAWVGVLRIALWDCFEQLMLILFSAQPPMIIKTFRFYDEDVYKDEIFSILSIARMNISVILAVKLDGRRHATAGFSENVIVAETSYQMLMLNGERA